jgi:hypothetical protein
MQAILMMRRLVGWAGLSAVLTTAAICRADEVFPVAHTEAIAVRVVDGLNGRPRARAVVVVVGGYSERDLDAGMWRQELLTDEAGQVPLADGLRNLPLLRVEVIKLRSCAAGGFGKTFSMELTRRDGLSSSNRCGANSAQNVAGTLTVFVADRKPWLKKHGAKKPASATIKELSEQATGPSPPSLRQQPIAAEPDALFFDID